ncbi:hypothetical protein [Micromonospora sp. NPDC048839]|uniref:hypothetical protein n=1 Tax=Micromonospora sp. NPDC048839 TaxID=3155641 RepID=UPI0033C164E8
MRLTPRKEEIQVVKDILESDEYANADQMAKALIKAVADALWMRDWYGVGTKFREDDPFWLPYGPFASESEALQTVNKYGSGVVARTTKLYSPGRLVAFHEGKDWPGYCRTCKHDATWHMQDGSSRGKCVSCPACKKFKK